MDQNAMTLIATAMPHSRCLGVGSRARHCCPQRHDGGQCLGPSRNQVPFTLHNGAMPPPYIGHPRPLPGWRIISSLNAMSLGAVRGGADFVPPPPGKETVLLLLQLTGLTHRESYLDMVMNVFVSCSIALIAVVMLGSIFGLF